MTQKIGRARAHTNIALIKYWGKRDKKLFLPMNSSLSLTLDAFYTDTKVCFDSTLAADEFYLNGQHQSQEEIEKISHFLDLFREYINESIYARVESFNFVPTAAGLASSASAFAALTVAAASALQLDLSLQELSKFARRGSGSSTRSLFGGFVEWDMGTDETDSMAVPIDEANWDIGMLVIAIDTRQKKITSRIGMDHTVETSPFYPAWISSSKEDLIEIKQAIAERNVIRIGEITEHNGMKMHATTLSAKPPFTYWTADSLRAQEAIRRVREELQLPAYITMDAGPNVKVLCRASDLQTLVDALSISIEKDKMIVSRPGPAARVLTEEEWKDTMRMFKENTDDNRS